MFLIFSGETINVAKISKSLCEIFLTFFLLHSVLLPLPISSFLFSLKVQLGLREKYQNLNWRLQPVKDELEHEPSTSSLSVLSLLCSDSLPTFLSESESDIVRRVQIETTNTAVSLISDTTVNKIQGLKFCVNRTESWALLTNTVKLNFSSAVT